jgi:hypothetical protein
VAPHQRILLLKKSVVNVRQAADTLLAAVAGDASDSHQTDSQKKKDNHQTDQFRHASISLIPMLRVTARYKRNGWRVMLLCLRG